MSATLFISDLHLDGRRPIITTLFLDFLAGLETSAHAGLYILGDLFEAWIGDDNDDPHDHKVLTALRETTGRGIPVAVMRGNRDFLLGSRFADTTGCTLLPDEVCVELDGQRTLLMHGDTLCTDDREYQQFRAMVRNPDWQRQFLAKPLAERRQLAAHLRETSRQRTGEKAAYIMDANAQAICGAFRQHGVRRLIHGHTHRPGVHDLTIDGETAQRIVLGDWYEQGSVLRCEDGRLELKTLPPN